MTMPSSPPLFSYEASHALTTIHYNPYKPNVMAVGCSNRSILLFSTANHTLSNLYSTLYHLPKDMEDNPPIGIETEFEIKDISWNPQNPSKCTSLLSSRHACSLRNGGLQCCRRLGHSTSVCTVIVDYHKKSPV